MVSLRVMSRRKGVKFTQGRLVHKQQELDCRAPSSASVPKGRPQASPGWSDVSLASVAQPWVGNEQPAETLKGWP